MEFSTSDIIQLISILISSLISIIAVIISAVSIHQNTKSLEESVKPCISIYVEQITICEQQSYFVIKNFGASAGIITDFQFLNPPDKMSQSLSVNLNRLKGIILAPGQSKLISLDCQIFKPDTIYTFIITYKKGKKTYTDRYDINIRNYTQIPTSRPENNSKYVLSNSLREIIERMI